jgi:hypothetical protein
MVKLSEKAGGGDGTYPYWVKRGDKLIKDKMIGADELVVPEEGMFKNLELYAIGKDTFQSTGQYPKEKRAIIMRILDEGHDNYKELVRTTVNYSETPEGLGPKTYIGQIFTAIRGGTYPDDEDTDDAFWLSMLGGRFQAILTVSDDGVYVNFAKDSIKACKSSAAKPKTKVSADDTDNELTAEDDEAA